jgi:hypothetical protein
VSDITAEMRLAIFVRDRERCVKCGSHNVTLQHRKAKGMGGIGEKHPDLTHADGIAMCATHNALAESADQDEALRFGWKVKRNCPIPCNQIPYYERITGNWYLPDDDGGRRWVDPGWARARVDHALAA